MLLPALLFALLLASYLIVQMAWGMTSLSPFMAALSPPSSHSTWASPHILNCAACWVQVAWGMTALSPFIPLYKGLSPKHIPKELAVGGPHPDRISLFWKARRLQALVFQDWPSLAPAAAAAIHAFEVRLWWWGEAAKSWHPGGADVCVGWVGMMQLQMNARETSLPYPCLRGEVWRTPIHGHC